MSSVKRFDAAVILAGLTGFQRNTVEHVIDRFYGREKATRFLVADETGLGKTMVARGVIARAIEQLERVPEVDRIDIVYVCSNTDIAQQNLHKLDVTGDRHFGIASRLSLLAKHSRHLTPLRGTFSKPVNLISFTPGTSFEKGWHTGKAEERAMLFLLLETPLRLSGSRGNAAARLLQGGVASLDAFRRYIDTLRKDIKGDVDETVARAFLAAIEREGLLSRFETHIDELGRRQSVPANVVEPVHQLIGEMRSTLARESIHLLQPDLIILDEFQRFRHLLDRHTEAGELAHHLFDHHQARVLLLSATPYKPFTYAEEAADGDDHYVNFMQTIGFLTEPIGENAKLQIADGLRGYRDSVIKGAPADGVKEALRAALLKVMVRTERPRSHGQTMAAEHLNVADDLPQGDLIGYVAIKALAREVSGEFSVDYWKSAPYFINFMDGYKIAEKIRGTLKDPLRIDRVGNLIKATQRVTAEQLRSYAPVDMGNARLRRLAAETVQSGWWKLLWVPASLPYFVPGGPYAEEFAASVTKRLIFSSWIATPTAIAALLSYEAQRLTAEGSRLMENTPEARRSVGNRLSYRVDPQGRAQSMTSLMLFWPMPALAAQADPRAHRRDSAGPFDPSVLRSKLAGEWADRLAGPEIVPGHRRRGLVLDRGAR
jgi:hypothetical protein